MYTDSVKFMESFGFCLVGFSPSKKYSVAMKAVNQGQVSSSFRKASYHKLDEKQKGEPCGYFKHKVNKVSLHKKGPYTPKNP